jgi:hypothetical protein
MTKKIYIMRVPVHVSNAEGLARLECNLQNGKFLMCSCLCLDCSKCKSVLSLRRRILRYLRKKAEM